MTSLMIVSFLIFVGLSGVILLADAELSTRAVSLPFAFLFIAISTLVMTGRIYDNGVSSLRSYLQTWLVLCALGVLITALAFTLA